MKLDAVTQKLQQTAETLKSNSETITYLNKQLSEAQKFSFRALVTNTSKQQIPQATITQSSFNNGPTAQVRRVS